MFSFSQQEHRPAIPTALLKVLGPGLRLRAHWVQSLGLFHHITVLEGPFWSSIPPHPEPPLPRAVSGTPQPCLSLPSAVSPHVTFTEEPHLHRLCTDSSYFHASTQAVPIAGYAPPTLSLRSTQNARFQAHWSLVHLLSEGTSPSSVIPHSTL